MKCVSPPSTSSTMTSSYRGVSPKSRPIKSARERKEERERKEVMTKLKDMIPALPQDSPACDLEVMQHIIDYIYQLQKDLNTEESSDSDQSGSDYTDSDMESLSDSFEDVVTPTKSSFAVKSIAKEEKMVESHETILEVKPEINSSKLNS